MLFQGADAKKVQVAREARVCACCGGRGVLRGSGKVRQGEFGDRAALPPVGAEGRSLVRQSHRPQHEPSLVLTAGEP